MKQAGYETYMTGKGTSSIIQEIIRSPGHRAPGMPRDTKEGYNDPRLTGRPGTRPTEVRWVLGRRQALV